MKATLFTSVLVLALPLAGVAQSTPFSRVFVGLTGFAGYYYVPDSYDAVKVFSPAPVLGLQLAPRLAVQASAAYYENKQDNFSSLSFTVVDTKGGALSYQGYKTSNIKRKTLVIPIMARYGFLDPAKRFQVELLGGLTLVKTSERENYTLTDEVTQNIVFGGVVVKEPSLAYLVTLGPGLRYHLSPHFDLTGDFLVSKAVNSNKNPYAPKAELSTNLAVGASYHFGQ